MVNFMLVSSRTVEAHLAIISQTSDVQLLPRAQTDISVLGEIPLCL